MSKQVEVKGPEDIVLPENPEHIKKSIFELRKMCIRYKDRAERVETENGYLRNQIRRLNMMIKEQQEPERPLISQSL